LVVPGGKVSSSTCWWIQRTSCVLHDTKRESAKKEAVIDSDCLQDTEGDFRNPDKRDNIRSEKDVGRYSKTKWAVSAGSI
jgi:hypothetical protein